MTEEKPKPETDKTPTPSPEDPPPDDTQEPPPGQRFFSHGSECWHDPKTNTFHI